MKTLNNNCFYVNGVERNNEHPSTFEIPDQESKGAIEKGDFVKVGIEFEGGGGERFWVKVTQAKPLQGLVANNLVSTDKHGLVKNDLIAFEADHVLDILKEEE